MLLYQNGDLKEAINGIYRQCKGTGHGHTSFFDAAYEMSNGDYRLIQQKASWVNMLLFQGQVVLSASVALYFEEDVGGRNRTVFKTSSEHISDFFAALFYDDMSENKKEMAAKSAQSYVTDLFEDQSRQLQQYIQVVLQKCIDKAFENAETDLSVDGEMSSMFAVDQNDCDNDDKISQMARNISHFLELKYPWLGNSVISFVTFPSILETEPLYVGDYNISFKYSGCPRGSCPEVFTRTYDYSSKVIEFRVALFDEKLENMSTAPRVSERELRLISLAARKRQETGEYDTLYGYLHGFRHYPAEDVRSYASTLKTLLARRGVNDTTVMVASARCTSQAHGHSANIAENFLHVPPTPFALTCRDSYFTNSASDFSAGVWLTLGDRRIKRDVGGYNLRRSGIRKRCQTYFGHPNGWSYKSCCAKRGPCGHGEGHCEGDDECEGSLVCGRHNCHWGHGNCCREAEERDGCWGYNR